MSEETGHEREARAYEAVYEARDFQELKRRYKNFVVPWTAAFMIWYLAYVACNNWARDFMSHKVVGHINDCERMFVFRALWFARGLPGELPSFDQNIAIAAVRFDERSLSDLVAEFRTVRQSTLYFFRNLPDEAWAKRGIASGNDRRVGGGEF